MTPRRTTYLIIFTLLALSAMLAVKGTVLTPVPASEVTGSLPEATTVVLAQFTTEAIRHTIKAVGSLRANESIMIRPEIAGRLRQVWFQEGQAV